jgi:hypothetical protein
MGLLFKRKKATTTPTIIKPFNFGWQINEEWMLAILQGW